MIVFDRLWKTRRKKRVSTYELRESCDIARKTIGRLRANENVETKTRNKLCQFLACPLEEIAQFLPDPKE